MIIVIQKLFKKSKMKNINLKVAAAVLLVLICSGCSKTNERKEEVKKSETKNEQNTENIGQRKDSTSKTVKYAKQSEDELMSKNISNFLVKDFLKKDLKSMTQEDRNFQMYLIDLNGDGKDEYFVRLMGTYFCGSGGCTFLLLDRYSEVITKFTVTDAPVYVTSEKENGWDVLYLKSGGKFRKVVYNKKSYPSNPSVLPVADYKPGDKDTAVFDDEKNPCRTYTF